MFIFQKQLFDVPRQENVKGACSVIPIQFDPAVEVSCPVLGEFVFFFYSRNKVLNMLSFNLFHTKVVDD